VDAEKSAYPVTFLIKNIATFVMPEILFKVKSINFIRSKILENRPCLQGATVT
jgi:hypothetical protein